MIVTSSFPLSLGVSSSRFLTALTCPANYHLSFTYFHFGFELFLRSTAQQQSSPFYLRNRQNTPPSISIIYRVPYFDIFGLLLHLPLLRQLLGGLVGHVGVVDHPPGTLHSHLFLHGGKFTPIFHTKNV